MLSQILLNSWQANCSQSEQLQAITNLEQGNVIFLPKLNFTLNDNEQKFLTPEIADPNAKNISYQLQSNQLWGIRNLTEEDYAALKAMLHRFAVTAESLINNLFPHYSGHLQMAKTSFRPLQVSNRNSSYRKDDRRLHVDAFPSAPNQGRRILRVFSNINPQDEPRVWRLGENFEQVAKRFLPEIRPPMPFSASVFKLLKITKSLRTAYDHYMLKLHDAMKKDLNYQKDVAQETVAFPAGSTWIVQTDDVSHAAMSGQYLLEQTFYLPVEAMQNSQKSPLKILERLLNRKLR